MGSSNSRDETTTDHWANAGMQDITTATESDDLVKPILEHGRFKNPFPTFEDRNLSHVWRLMKSNRDNDNSNIPWGNSEELNRTLPIVSPDYTKLGNPPKDKIQCMWVGHASMLVQFDGITVLTDPVFSRRCGPWGILGPKRYRDTPCNIDELPDIDAVLISHNHYDHLDHDAVVKLNRKFGDKLRWYVGMGQQKWMRNAGCKHVLEMSWWQEHTFEKNDRSFMVACTPNQHWCQRNAIDRNKALWSSWVVKGPTQSFYFAGDTGYCYAFEQIGRKYGPISMAAIPIGAYEPRWFMRPQHVNPEEAIAIQLDIKAIKAVGIHWGTFKLTTEHYLEPREKLAELLKSKGLDPKSFITVAHGDVVTIDNED